MTVTMPTPSVVFTEWTVGEFAIPCELVNADHECGEPAEWIMWRNPCCPHKLYPALACTGCKDMRLLNLISVECDGCGKVWPDAAEAYSYVEALNAKGSK